MLPILSQLEAEFDHCLRKEAIPDGVHGFFKKWLRYYLDFCRKYQFPCSRRETLPHFLTKLQDKNQTQRQLDQAADAIKLFFRIAEGKASTRESAPDRRGAGPAGKFSHFGKHLSVREPLLTPPSPGSVEPLKNPSRQNMSPATGGPGMPETGSPRFPQTKSGKAASWLDEYASLADEIQVRHYSVKTLKSYKGWVQAFQVFTKSKPPEPVPNQPKNLTASPFNTTCSNAHHGSHAAPVGIRITQPNGQNPPSLIHRRSFFPMK